LNSEKRNRGLDEELPAYMDLLSHDILNLNQTVLSSIEFMTSSSSLDDRSMEHAERATSQIRISTQLVESINKLCLLQKEDDLSTTTAVLADEVAKAAHALNDILPHRRVRLTIEGNAEAVVMDSKDMVSQSILNALINMVQLDPSKSPEIAIKTERPGTGGRTWRVRLEDSNLALSTRVDLNTIMNECGESRSRTVRLAGILLSKMMVETLGGEIEIDCCNERGGAFLMTYRGAAST
jgi:light-regulated signal transduction histidine kinase (bacteriophytochrome)